MKATVLDSGDSRRRKLLVAGVILSLLAHGALAWGVGRIPERTREAAQWVQVRMNIAEPPPAPPPPEPPKRVEPPKPPMAKKELVKPVPLEQLPPTPVDAPPPPPERKVRRLVQGLDANSFAPGAGTGLNVRAGNTTAVRATEELARLEDANDFVARPYASVSTPPRLKGPMPELVVPQEVVDLNLEGSVEVELTISAEGTVLAARVVRSLHPAADAACAEHFRTKTRWTPGILDGSAVPVSGLRKNCRFEKVEN
jgi:outer membrane biosynthesis protein TonB